MNITNDKEVMIFKNEYNGRINYSVGLTKKDKDGKYINGYMNVQFKKDIELENQTKIKIKEAWLSFNQHEKKTYPYIFINDFELVEKKESNPYEEFGNNMKTEFNVGEQIQITDEDLPF